MAQLSVERRRFSHLALGFTLIYAFRFTLIFASAGTQGTTFQSQLLGQNVCSVGHAYRPSSTDDVLNVVKSALDDRESTGREFLIRAVRGLHYFTNNFSCIVDSIDAGPTIMVDMSEMDQILAVNQEEGWVSVGAGITFESLGEQLLEMGLGLEGLMISPPFSGMSVGEAIETASHSSSLAGPATLGPFLKAAVIVDGTGQVLALDEPGDLLEGSMGLLGLLTEVTLGISKAKKLLVKTLRQEDLRMLEDIREIVDRSEAQSLDITWSPAASLYTARVWYEAEEGHEGEAVNGLSISNERWLNELEGLLIQDHGDHSDTLNIMCQIMGEWTAHPLLLGATDVEDRDEEDLLRDPGSHDSSIVGWSTRMESSRCLGEGGESCLWRRAKLTPHAFMIASEDLAPWSEDVISIFSNTAGCPNFLVYLRFVMASNAPLAMNSGRQMVAVDIQTLGSLTLSGARGQGGPSRHQELIDEVLQMSLCKYNARPHWSLASNRMLVPGPSCPFSAAHSQKELEKFSKRMEKFDPHGLFLHPMFIRMVEGAGQEYYMGCAIKEDCFCAEDLHCGGGGYKCLPGQAFAEYKVCRRESEKGHDEL